MKGKQKANTGQRYFVGKGKSAQAEKKTIYSVQPYQQKPAAFSRNLGALHPKSAAPQRGAACSRARQRSCPHPALRHPRVAVISGRPLPQGQVRGGKGPQRAAAEQRPGRAGWHRIGAEDRGRAGEESANLIPGYRKSPDCDLPPRDTFVVLKADGCPTKMRCARYVVTTAGSPPGSAELN